MASIIEDVCRADFWIFVLLQLGVLLLCMLAVWNRADRVRELLAASVVRLRRLWQTALRACFSAPKIGDKGDKDLAVVLEARVSLRASASVKRGELSLRRLYTAHSLSMLAVVQIMATVQVSFLEGWRSLVSVGNVLLLSYLVLCDPWFRNKALGWIRRMEERWED